MKTNYLDSVNADVFKYSGEGIWILDSCFQTINYNPSFARIFKIDESPSPKFKADELLKDRENAALLSAIKSKKNPEGEVLDFKIKLKQGRFIWIAVHFKNVVENGLFLGKILFIKNITGQKKIHKNQIENLRLYFSLFEDSPIPIWDEDFSGLKNMIVRLKRKGITDFEHYLSENPAEINVFASKIRVNKINNAVVYLNEASSKEEVLQNLPYLRTEHFPQYIIKQVVAIANDERFCEFDAVLKTVKGNIRHVLFKWTVVKGHESDYSRVYLTTTDLTNRIIEENILLQQSNREKEVLLREIHHRVKNNFQIIASLIRLQISTLQDPKLESALLILLNRIYSMSTVHEILYRSEKLEFINLDDYLVHLTRLLIDSLNVSCQIDLELNAAQLEITLDQASPFGLIVNELITNSIKHGFSEMTKGKLYIQGKVNTENQIEIEIGDNGWGICPNMEFTDSLGLNLVESLVEQLNADLIRIEKKPGTHYKLIF